MNAPAPQPTLTDFNIHINEANINLIGAALGNLPYAQVSGLIADLRQQVQQQQQAYAQFLLQSAANQRKAVDQDNPAPAPAAVPDPAPAPAPAAAIVEGANAVGAEA